MLKSARPWQPAIRQLTDAGDDPHRRSKAGGPLSTRGRLRPLRRLSWSNHIGVHYD